MSFDEPLQAALTRAVDDIRGHLEAEWRSFALDLIRRAGEERAAAVAQAVEATTADARREREAQLAQAREEAQGQLADVRLQAQAQQDELRRVSASQIDDLTRLLAVSKTELEASRRQLDAMRQQLDATESEFAAARRGYVAHGAQLADALGHIDSARTLGDVLDVLANSAAREVERVAVLVLRDHRLVGWRLSGFPNATGSARSISLSLDDAGIAGGVVKTGVVSSRSTEPGDGRQLPTLPPFAHDGDERDAVALPIVVGGEVVAVLYADAHSSTASNGWLPTLEVLARHASRVLESLTVQRAVGAPLASPRSAHAVRTSDHGTALGGLT